MRKLILLASFSINLLVLVDTALAQNSVGIGTESPNPRAVLQLVSPGNNQGFLVPRLTTAQRTAQAFVSNLSPSENGLLVYDTNLNNFFYWQNDSWQLVSGQELKAGQGVRISDQGEITVEIPAAQDLTLTNNILRITGNANAANIDLTPYLNIQNAAQVSVTPTEALVSTNVQAALIELQTEIIANGNGDMLRNVYDPGNVLGNAFDLANHIGNLPSTRITGLGTAATLNAGTGINDLVQLDAVGLPPVDGSRLTNLTASQIPELGALAVLNTVGSAQITNNTIINEDISPSALIAGTKVVPNFGPQNISTSGTVTGDAFFGNGAGLTNIVVPDASITGGTGLGAKLATNTITNDNISPTAAIAGTKVNPAFGAQNITTTGTINAGAITATSFTGNGAGLTGITGATVNDGSITGGTGTGAKIATNTITNDNISPTAAIAGTKVNPAFGAQNITTTGTVTATSFTGNGAGLTGITGATVNDGSITGGTGAGAKIATNTITNDNISPTAAIAGTKVNPAFGAQNITTTGTVNAGAITATSFTGDGSGLTGVTVSDGTVTGGVGIGAKIATNTITNDNISLTAAIDGTKINPTFGAQNIATSGTITASSYTGDGSGLTGVTVDDGTITGGVGLGAKIASNTITNDNISTTAGIAGTKILPNFGNQIIETTAAINGNRFAMTSNIATGAVGYINKTESSNDWPAMFVEGNQLTGSLLQVNNTLTDPNAGLAAFTTQGNVKFSIRNDGLLFGRKLYLENSEVTENTARFISYNPLNNSSAVSIEGHSELAPVLFTYDINTNAGKIASFTSASNGEVASISNTGVITANSYIGDGSGLTGISGATVNDGSITGGIGTGAKIATNTITNDNISTTAAIAGSKINPSFSQPISVSASAAVAAIDAIQGGSGAAGVFQIDNIGSSAPALVVTSNASGNAININYTGAGHSLYTSGSVSAGTYYGDGSNLTNLPGASKWVEDAGDINRLTGNVGIGTTNPSDQLHTTGTVRFQNYSGGTTRYLTVDNNGVIGTGASIFSDPITAVSPLNGRVPYYLSATGLATSPIRASGTQVSINSEIVAGRVFQAISTNTDLPIYGESSGNGTTAIWGSSLNATAGTGVRGVGTGAGIGVWGSTSGSGVGGYFSNSGTGAALAVGNTGSGPAALFESGNVGIGVANPSQRLDVAGTVRANNFSYSTAVTKYSTIGVHQFSPEFTLGFDPTLLMYVENGAAASPRVANAQYLNATLAAPLVLPNGATITLVEAGLWRAAAATNDPKIEIYRKFITGAPELLCTLVYSNTPGSVQVVSNNVITNPTIDNNNYQYWIRFTGDAGPSGAFWSYTSGVRITYTINAPE